MSEVEHWRPVPGYEELYSVSDLGRVRSETARNKWPAGRILRPKRHPGGHLQVNLCRDGERRMMKVHRLVMAAFVGPCPEGMEVAHGNGDRTDNRLENLRYATHGENMLDGHKYGGRVGRQILTLAQVAEIRARLTAGESQRSIARRFGVGQMTISDIKRGYSWRHHLDQELAA